jgi:hypothetical protein
MPGSLKSDLGARRELDGLEPVEDEQGALAADVLGEAFAAGPGIEGRVGHAEPDAQGVIEEGLGGGLTVLRCALGIEGPA